MLLRLTSQVTRVAGPPQVTAFFTLLGLVGVGALMVYIFSTRDELVDSLTAPPSAVNKTAVANNITSTVTAQQAPVQDMNSASLDLGDIFKCVCLAHLHTCCDRPLTPPPLAAALAPGTRIGRSSGWPCCSLLRCTA